MEFEPMLTPREKSPLPKMSPEEDRTRDAVDSKPKHYQLSYSGPQFVPFNAVIVIIIIIIIIIIIVCVSNIRICIISCVCLSC